MKRRVGLAAALLLAVCAPLHSASANLDDDKPWNWEDENVISGAEGNSASVSLTSELRDRHQHPALKLVIDRPSWDAYLNEQLKQPVLSKRLGHTPGSRCGMAFRVLRDYGNAGIWPGYGNPPDTTDLDAEFRSMVNEMSCKYDLKAAEDRLEYNPQTKVLTYFAGKKNGSSVESLQPDLIKLAKQHFPKLKAWYIRHGKIPS